MVINSLQSEVGEKISNIFAAEPAVKLAYLFGSRADGSAGPLSDYDFCVYFDESLIRAEQMNLKFKLQHKLEKYLAPSSVDLVILNSTRSPELKFQIISEGRLLLDREPFKVLVEPKIMSEYFDFKQSLLRHSLTAA